MIEYWTQNTITGIVVMYIHFFLFGKTGKLVFLFYFKAKNVKLGSMLSDTKNEAEKANMNILFYTEQLPFITWCTGQHCSLGCTFRR